MKISTQKLRELIRPELKEAATLADQLANPLSGLEGLIENLAEKALQNQGGSYADQDQKNEDLTNAIRQVILGFL